MGIFDPQEREPQSRGISGRLIIALVIAAFGLFMYFSQSQQNPITGEWQNVSLSPSDEIRLGLQSAPLMARQMGGEVPDDDPRLIEVRRIGNYLVEHTNANKSPWKFKFHLLADTKTVNAFALPGGQVFITAGLYDKLKTEAQLAGVLSHEMGHVIQRHSAQQMAKGQLGGLLVTAVGVGTTDSQTQGQSGAMMAAAVVNQMMQLRYSRSDESEADTWGLKLMSQAGFTPIAMIEVMKILKEAGARGGSLEIFQTHPNPDLRIAQINAYLKEHPPAPGLTEGKNLPQYSRRLLL